MFSLNSSELHMYTGLNCTAFSILRKRLEPILTSYGSNPEKIHQLCILNLPVCRSCWWQSGEYTEAFCSKIWQYVLIVNQSTVFRTLYTWIPILAKWLEQFIQWPQTTIGSARSSYHPSTFGIGDGTLIYYNSSLAKIFFQWSSN